MTDEITIKTIVKPTKKLYSNENGNWFIYGCDSDTSNPSVIPNKYGNIAISGNMPPLDIGEEYKVELKRSWNEKRGEYTYAVSKIAFNAPKTAAEERRFLERQLTPTQMRNLEEVYSSEGLLDRICNNEVDLKKVKGLGEATLEKIKEKINKNKDKFEAIAFFSEFGCSDIQINQILEFYHSNILVAISQTKANPYSLTKIGGMGFKRVDPIARKMGIKENSPYRIKSGISYLLEQAASDGNTALKRDALFDVTYELLRLQAVDIIPILSKYNESNFDHETDFLTVESGSLVMLKKYFLAERFIAETLVNTYITKNKEDELDFDVEEFITEQEEKLNVTFTDEQKGIFSMVKSNKFGCLVGNAGTGKSFGMQTIINLCDKLSLNYLALSPTGKASKVLSGYIGREAFTIHKKLVKMGGEQPTIYADVIIVDEASMVDVVLFKDLLKAIQNPETRIYLVGDDFQLPSVGAGRLLYDLLETKEIPRVKLTQVFRQAEGSMLDLATKVRFGERVLPETSEEAVRNFGATVMDDGTTFINKEDTYIFMNDDVGALCQTFGALYPNAIEKNGVENIVTLTPRKAGAIGTYRLNLFAQGAANPTHLLENKTEFPDEIRDVVYRVGDRVLNLINTTKLKTILGGDSALVNGDTGTIVNIYKNDKKNLEMVIDFDGIEIIFSKSDLKNLTHTYAMTIHKSQGSQYKTIFVFIDSSHYFQLNANLIYTALTRGTDRLVLFCQGQTVNQAVRKRANNQRNTYLQKLLRKSLVAI